MKKEQAKLPKQASVAPANSNSTNMGELVEALTDTIQLHRLLGLKPSGVLQALALVLMTASVSMGDDLELADRKKFCDMVEACKI